jgi:hypothetical protein
MKPSAAVLDRAQHREAHVLVLLLRLAEPRVVGQVDEGVDALVGDVAGEARQDVLVADQRAEAVSRST